MYRNLEIKLKMHDMDNFWDTSLPSDYYDSILKKGLNKGRGIQANWHNLTFLKVSSTINKEDLHLDYACGSGSFIGNYLYQNSIGVDISNNQIEYAIKTYSEKGKFYIIEEFDFKAHKEFFNSISIIGLFEYLDRDEALLLLEKLYSILKKDGKVIITTPNYSTSMRFLEKLSHGIGPIDYSSEHKIKYKKTQLEEILVNSKFKNFKIEKFMNIGVFFSIFSLELGRIIVKMIDKLFQNKYGFLFFVELKK